MCKLATKAEKQRKNMRDWIQRLSLRRPHFLEDELYIPNPKSLPNTKVRKKL